jgi:hypothetical protein
LLQATAAEGKMAKLVKKSGDLHETKDLTPRFGRRSIDLILRERSSQR